MTTIYNILITISFYYSILQTIRLSCLFKYYLKQQIIFIQLPINYRGIDILHPFNILYNFDSLNFLVNYNKILKKAFQTNSGQLRIKSMIQRLLQLHKNKKKLHTEPASNSNKSQRDLFIGENKPIFQSRLHSHFDLQNSLDNETGIKKIVYQPKSDRAAFNRKFISIKMRKKNMYAQQHHNGTNFIKHDVLEKGKKAYQNEKLSIKIDLGLTNFQAGYLTKNYFCVNSEGPAQFNFLTNTNQSRKRSLDSKFTTSAIWPTCSKAHQLKQQTQQQFQKYKKDEKDQQPTADILTKTRYLTTRSLSNRKSSYTHHSTYEQRNQNKLKLTKFIEPKVVPQDHQDRKINGNFNFHKNMNSNTNSHQNSNENSNSNLHMKLKMSVQERNNMLSNSIDISPWKYGHSKNNVDLF